MTPIRKGSNPVKVPFPIKSKDPTFAAWCNEVRTAIRQLEGRIPTANIGKSVSSSLQFKIYGIRYDAQAEKWLCKVRPGWVRSRNPDSDATEPIKDWMPTVGDPAVALDADEPPDIEIADGQTVYCRVTTTAKGIIEEAPTIEAATTPEAGVHFQPPNQETEGDLYFPLCNITIEGDPEVVTLEQIQQGGPIDVVPNLPELKNVGAEREVFKGRESAGDTYDFRTLKQFDGGSAAQPIIKPEPADPGAAGDLEVIEFKYITQRGTGAEIKVVDVAAGEGIRIQGNDVDEDLTNVRKFDIVVKDGLVKSFTKIDDSGWWGTVGWQFSPAGGGSPQTLELDFEAGILVAVTNSQGAPVGAGTEADPALAVFQFGDTDT
jgi:hypothetical protein